ncbi:SH3 domain-containing protein [Luteolibacter sp. AS25]|uniref:SH3 domain-containing protein n=1 Tax=Luteolibacter sp. AS25 TaxID=3135776 RepID=UPI00398B6C22
MKFIANSDYEENNTLAIHLTAGQEVTSGPADRTWPGWIWAMDSFGRNGYVPAEILEPLGEDRWAAMEDFDPTVLRVKKGDEVESLRQVHGWHWCKNDTDMHGWVADYLLKPL